MSTIRPYQFFYRSLFLLFISIATAIQLSAEVSPDPPEKLGDGVLFHVGGNLLKLEACGDNIIRVAYAKAPAFFAHKTPAASASARSVR